MLKSTIFFLQCVLIVFVSFVWLSEAEHICDDNKIINDTYTISNIKSKYKKGVNVNEIFKWIHSCGSMENQITGYNTLYKQITKRNKKAMNIWTLKFAQELMPLLEDTIFLVKRPYSIQLQDLYYNIPNCVIALATGGDVSIKSVKYHEYLVASDLKENGQSHLRNVFFKNLTKTNNDDTKWIPKIDQELNGAFLELENVLYKETIMVSWATNNYGEHIIYTQDGVQKEFAQWIVEPVDKFGEKCIFLNPNTGQHLCVYDERFYSWSHYRRIFTTNIKSIEDPDCHFFVN